MTSTRGARVVTSQRGQVAAAMGAMLLAWASVARRGDVQAARAAAGAGVPFSLSTLSACSIGQVAAAERGFWFQLYIVKDRGFVADMLAQAQEAGCGALLLTVDLAVPGTRYRD